MRPHSRKKKNRQHRSVLLVENGNISKRCLQDFELIQSGQGVRVDECQVISCESSEKHTEKTEEDGQDTEMRLVQLNVRGHLKCTYVV